MFNWTIGLATLYAVLSAACAKPSPTPTTTTPAVQQRPLQAPTIVRFGSSDLLHPGVRALRYSPDGSVFVSAGSDPYVKVWDADSGALLAVVQPNGFSLGTISSIAIGTEGQVILAGGQYEETWILRREGGVLSAKSLGHCRNARGLELWPDQAHVACGTDEGLWVVNLQSGRIAHTLSLEPVTRLEVTVTEGALHATRQNGSLEWTTPIGEPTVTNVWTTSSNIVSATSDDGRYVATGSDPPRWRIFGPDSSRPDDFDSEPQPHEKVAIVDLQGNARFELGDHGDHVAALAFSPNSDMLLSAGGGDDLIHRWRIPEGTEIPMGNQGHVSRALFVAASQGGSSIVSASRHSLRAWDTKTARETAAVPAGHVVAVSSAAQAVAIAEGKTIRLFRSGLAAAEVELKVEYFVRHIALDAEARRMVTAGDEGNIQVWDTSTGKVLRTLERTATLTSSEEWQIDALPISIDALRISGDGSRIFVASYANLWVWDAESGTALSHLGRGSFDHMSVADLAVSEDGSWVAAVGQSNDEPPLSVWHGKSLARVPLRIPVGDSYVVAISASGDRIAFAQEAKILVYRRTGETFSLEKELEGHDAEVRNLSFLPGLPPRLISASNDSTLLLWPLGSPPATAATQTKSSVPTTESKPDRGKIENAVRAPETHVEI